MTARTVNDPELDPVFVRIAQMALAVTQGEPINRLPGAWRHRFGSDSWRWDIAVNGHAEPVASPQIEGLLIEPFEAHVYVNGWPFAILSPIGERIMGSGEGANGETFLAAIAAEIERLTGERAP